MILPFYPLQLNNSHPTQHSKTTNSHNPTSHSTPPPLKPTSTPHPRSHLNIRHHHTPQPTRVPFQPLAPRHTLPPPTPAFQLSHHHAPQLQTTTPAPQPHAPRPPCHANPSHLATRYLHQLLRFNSPTTTRHSSTSTPHQHRPQHQPQCPHPNPTRHSSNLPKPYSPVSRPPPNSFN